jgi:hypothetical protein
MVFRVIFGLTILLFCNARLYADELKINPNHPEQYTVVKGDTLWDISGKFLQHPWQWPKLWHNNPQIKDPHWIYPGDTLYFSYVNGEPRLSLSRGESGVSEEKLEPQARDSALSKAIRVIPTDAIAQFLSSPRVVGEEDLNNAPYVLGIAGDERLVAGSGDRIYVRGVGDPQGLGYTIFRRGRTYVSPETKEVLGYEAEYVGDATIQSSGDISTFYVNKSNGMVKEGDRLMLNNDRGLALSYFPSPPSQQINGYIISVMGGITQIGVFDIVVIDKGVTDGIAAGHVFNIYRKGRIVMDKYISGNPEVVALPEELAGVLMVFRPFDRVSYALVMSAQGPVHTLDRIQTP